MPKTIRLAVYFNDTLRAIRELTLPFVIGRSREANLTIPHPMVSRRHCLIFEDRGTVRMQDLGSLNGTFRGDERVQDITLQDGDEFLIGNIRFAINPVLDENAVIDRPGDESSFVDSEIILVTPDDLPPPLPGPQAGIAKPVSQPTQPPKLKKPPVAAVPPPLPPQVQNIQPSVPPIPPKPPTPEISTSGPLTSIASGNPTTPSFIKPLPLSLTPDEGDNGIIELSDVIDLAKIADKQASTPRFPRKQE